MPGPDVCHIVRFAVCHTTGRGMPRPYGAFWGTYTMKKLNIDNWFFRTMALIGDWVFLSVLWVIGCLPVVTAGAATLSVFAVAHKMAAGQDYAVCRDFCKAFRRDFRQATVIWLPMLALALLLVLDGWYGGRIPAPWGGLLRGAAVAAALVWVLSFSWGLALLARFTYKKSADALKNGLVLALRTPRAALLTLLLAVLPWAVLTGVPALFFYLLPFWLFVLPGAAAWGIARAMRPAVTKLEHKNNYYLDREENP